MRTFTVVPSFEGESAFFELPDIGFQGDHLSFAILFNLTELTEHWPDILPSMIVTDPKGNTFIAPHTSWNAETHVFTWAISSTETTYDGYLKCQLKCMSADDPETIVCMSRICQTKVYESLAAAEDPPEAFQSWIDTLVQLGAEINADAEEILASVETTETNARAAQAAADEANVAKAAAQQARNVTEQMAQNAIRAQEMASTAQQQAQQALEAAEQATETAVTAVETITTALEEMDADVTRVERASSAATDAADEAERRRATAQEARVAAEAARDAAVEARDASRTAQGNAETAEQGARTAQIGAENAQAATETAHSNAEAAKSAAETAQGNAETAESNAEAAQSAAEDAQSAAEAARDRAETARTGVEAYASTARKWAEGKDYQGNAVGQNDETYENNSKYWAGQSESNATRMFNYLADVESRTVIIKSIPFSVRTTDWTDGLSGTYPIYFDIEDSDILQDYVPVVVFEETSLELASNASMCAAIYTSVGSVRLRAKEVPEGTLSGILYLIGAEKSIPIVIRTTDWVAAESGKYHYYADVRDEDIDGDRAPMIVLDETSLQIASECGVGTTTRSYTGYVRIHSVDIPDGDLTGMLHLVGEGLSEAEG